MAAIYKIKVIYVMIAIRMYLILGSEGQKYVNSLHRLKVKGNFDFGLIKCHNEVHTLTLSDDSLEASAS